MEGSNASSRKDPILGEATRWFTVLDVLWSASPATSQPLPK